LDKQDLPKGEKEVRAALPALKPLGAKAAAYQLVAAAELAAETAAAEEEARAGVGALGLAAGAKAGGAAAPSGRYLADATDAWEAFGGVGGKGVRVYAPPFPPQPVPARPIMLDTAVSYIDYPSLDHRCGQARQAEAKSTFARLFGGWGASS
jgi:hypothetical protein